MKKRLVLIFSLMVAGILLIGGCNGGDLNSTPAKAGDNVKVDYTGKLDDGTVFDSSKGKTPMEFTVGAGQMIKGFDAAIPGMKVGETKTVKIPADDAYGQYQADLVTKANRSQFPSNATLTIGQQFQIPNGMSGKVTAINGDEITLDFNHELAGKDLTFEITLVAITPPATTPK